MGTENSAVRAVRRLIAAMIARDFGAYSDGLAEDYQYEDRRKGLQSIHGKRAEVEQARALGDLDLERVDMDVLETRGDHTALVRLSSQAAGFEVVLVLVSRVDTNGLALVAVAFDEDDIDAARAELETQTCCNHEH